MAGRKKIVMKFPDNVQLYRIPKCQTVLWLKVTDLSLQLIQYKLVCCIAFRRISNYII